MELVPALCEHLESILDKYQTELEANDGIVDAMDEHSLAEISACLRLLFQVRVCCIIAILKNKSFCMYVIGLLRRSFIIALEVVAPHAEALIARLIGVSG